MLQKFVETVSIDSKLFKKIIPDAQLQEKIQSVSASNHLQEGTATAWEVPISKYDELNENGRMYPKALWERVINEQRNVWAGSPMLSDHPQGDQDGSPQNICGVWLEARVGNDGYVYGTFVPSGRLGEDMEKHLKNGLRAGTSSSGFGELMSDKKTVDPATYMIERLSDWVLTPSQGTYFTYEGATRETKNASDSRLGESANNTENVVREKASMKITKLEEKKFRKDMEAFLEDAQKLTDPQDRLREFEEIATYLEEGLAPDLKERVTVKMTEQREEIRKTLTEANLLSTELGVSTSKDLKEKLTAIAEDAELLKYEATDWKKIAATLQAKLDSTREALQSRSTPAYVEHLKGKIQKLYAERKASEANLKAQQAKLTENSKKKDKLLEAIDAEIADYKKISEASKVTNQKLAEQIERLQQHAAGLAKQLKESKAEFTSYKNLKEAAPKIAESPSASIARYMNFREGDSIDSYWADLALRHGADIKVYERKIRSCKTVREAMAVYMKILPMLNESVEYEAARIPESVSLTRKERGAMLEKAGAKMTTDDAMSRMPETWI